MKYLKCYRNLLTSLPSLPASLLMLDASQNNITTLPAIPPSIQSLNCYQNSITTITVNSNSIRQLECGYNPLGSISITSTSIDTLGIAGTSLTVFPALPNCIRCLNCNSDHFTIISNLPTSLITFYCILNSSLSTISLLPDPLETLDISDNPLLTFPVLPNALQSLSLRWASFTSLPQLPNSILYLDCSYGQLQSLTNFPNSLQYLDCSYNNITCFPTFPNSLGYFGQINITGNPNTCVPNYVYNVDSALIYYPLCIPGDVINNPNGCNNTQGVIGYTYQAGTGFCNYNVGDAVHPNVPLKLYDASSSLIGQVTTLSNGIYDFSYPAGTYTVKVDTAGMPFTTGCSYQSLDSTVTLTTASPLANNVNFALACKPGNDVGVQSVYRTGIAFPGQQHNLRMVAGDMMQWYNFNCSAGVSGAVQITVTGNVTYNGIVPGALTPSVAGTIYTYSIADFGVLNNLDAFGPQDDKTITIDISGYAKGLYFVEVNTGKEIVRKKIIKQ